MQAPMEYCFWTMAGLGISCSVGILCRSIQMLDTTDTSRGKGLMTTIVAAAAESTGPVDACYSFFTQLLSPDMQHFLVPSNHHHLCFVCVCINITLLNPLVTADKSHNSYGCSRLKICHLSLNTCCFGAFAETADAVIFWGAGLSPFLCCGLLSAVGLFVNPLNNALLLKCHSNLWLRNNWKVDALKKSRLQLGNDHEKSETAMNSRSKLIIKIITSAVPYKNELEH